MIGSEYKTIHATTSNKLDTLEYVVMIKSIVIFNEDETTAANIKISVNDPIGFTIHEISLDARNTISLSDILAVQPEQQLIIEASTTINIVITYVEDKGITLA